MPNQPTEFELKLQQIKEAIIYGIPDNNGKKYYPSLAKACKVYKANYDSVRHKLKVKDLRQIRQDVKAKLDAAKQGKKCDQDVEDRVENDDKFMRTANKLRLAAELELERLIKQLKGELPSHPSTSYGYNLMNCGKALESAQKVYKVSVGEPDSIQEVNGETKVNLSNPTEDVKNLEETLKNGVGAKDIDAAVEEFTGKKVNNTVNENTKKSDISAL